MKIVIWAIIILSSWCAFAATLTVDSKAPNGTSGTYATVQAAVDAAKGGDEIVVKGGEYYGRVRILKVYEKPLTIRAAKGERAILSGFTPITGWKDEGKGVYSAHIDHEASDLFLGYEPLQCSRCPADGTRIPFTKTDEKERLFKTDPVKDAPFLAEIAKDPMGAVCYYHHGFADTMVAAQFTSYDAKTGVIAFDKKNWKGGLRETGNSYSFMNHPALIVNPGDWAFAPDKSADPRKRGGTIFFKPAVKTDLDRVRYRVNFGGGIVTMIKDKASVGNVVLDGFEITGAASSAIYVKNASDITVKNCIIHHNSGVGIQVSATTNLTISSNVIIANGDGIVLGSIKNGLAEGNEIGFNYADGFVISWHSEDVVARRNYLHHHFLLAHPDGFQLYRFVKNIRIEENFLAWSAGIMAEEAEQIVASGNIFFATGGAGIVCGHQNSHFWKMQNNTFCCAGLPFKFTGHDYELDHSLVVGERMLYPNVDKTRITSRENCYVPEYIAQTAEPWKLYKSLEAIRAAHGFEVGSTTAPNTFANVPKGYATGGANGAAKDSVLLRKDQKINEIFAVGDKVEFNGDGVLRTVTGIEGQVLKFSPAFPLPVFRRLFAVNWGPKAKSCLPLLKQVNGCGSPVNPAAFASGDLLGKGTRTIPVLPADVIAAMPDPNKIVIPPSGH